MKFVVIMPAPNPKAQTTNNPNTTTGSFNITAVPGPGKQMSNGDI